MMQNPHSYTGINQGDLHLGHKCLAVAGWFTALIIAMAFSNFTVVIMPAAVVLTVILSRDTDYLGLMLCLLLPLSFSWSYQIGQVPEIVLITRILLLVSLTLIYFKARRGDFEYKMPALLFGLFVICAAIGSYYYSMFVAISETKLLFATLFIGGLLLSSRASAGFPHVHFAVMATIGFISAFYYLVAPEIGYAFVMDPNAGPLASGRFSGIMNHPQLLAGILAVNLPLMLYAFMTKMGVVSRLALAAFIVSLLLIVISSSRTGLLAATVSCGCALYFYNKHSTNLVMKIRGRMVAMWLLGVIAVGSTLATDQVKMFIFKTDDLERGFSLSGRDEIINASWQGFLERPAFGNGFQVPSDYTEHGSAGFGLSSDATSIEKCFFITMLLEEVGIVGTVLFLCMLGTLISYWRRKGSYVSIAAALSFLAINTGESCILSPSSIGGLCWISIFAVHNLRLPEQPARP